MTIQNYSLFTLSFFSPAPSFLCDSLKTVTCNRGRFICLYGGLNISNYIKGSKKDLRHEYSLLDELSLLRTAILLVAVIELQKKISTYKFELVISLFWLHPLCHMYFFVTFLSTFLLPLLN